MRPGGASWLTLAIRAIAESLQASTLLGRGLLLVGLTISLVALTWSGALRPIDDTLMDWRFALLKRAPTRSVAIVEIDSRSIAELKGWPWSRRIYAAAIQNLQAAGAKIIGIDVDFSSRSDPSGDSAFQDALGKRPGEVILPVFLQPESNSNPSQLRSTAPDQSFLHDAAKASVNLVVEPGGIARRGFYGSDTADGYLPS